MASIFKPRIGVDLGGTKIEAVALDGDGDILVRERIPSPGEDYDGIVSAIAGLVESVRQDLGIEQIPVGIGTPGAVSAKTGKMKNCNSTCLNGRPLREDLCDRLGVPVRIANDADCFALSEASDGAGQGAASVFGVILGTGVGGGICINGKLLSGANAICGEWGHNPVPLNALQVDESSLPAPESTETRCYCGRFNCVEQFLSGPAFELSFEKLTGTRRDAREVTELAENGDEIASALVERYFNLLALSLSAVINVLDPEVIVLGGGMSRTRALYARVPEYLKRYVFSDQVLTRVMENEHGDSSGVRGAAWLWTPEEIYG